MKYTHIDENEDFPESINDFQYNKVFKLNTANIKKIKCFIFDIDGVLTDGTIQKDNNGKEIRTFNTQDNWIISKLHELGFYTVIICDKISELIIDLGREMNIEYVYENDKNKKDEVYHELNNKLSLNAEEICYIGDDLIDIPLLKKAGFPATVKNARPEVKMVDNIYVSFESGGNGGVRDIIEFILKQQSKFEKLF